TRQVAGRHHLVGVDVGGDVGGQHDRVGLDRVVEEQVGDVDLDLAGDAAGLGALMNASHTSLRDDYEVSCRELDLMVELALQQAGCYGARMTGAGFGGCAISLVETPAAQTLAQRVAVRYTEETGLIPEIYLCQPEDGAGIA
ncbi:MAG: galactokinase, partial [Anaerolineae bacterium]|nr:galactokinase [Anaerolineae bacterium]